jgi:dienelactone hydrolase
MALCHWSRTWSLVLLATLIGACSTAVSDSPAANTMATSAPDGAVEHIPVRVMRPSGAGPFPAVVILHDCSGVGPRSSHAPARWARELTRRGYVVVMPDRFTTRGFPDGVCTEVSPQRVDVSPRRRARDAYAALAHARALPDVDGRRVGLMGGSHGGSTTLTAMARPSNAGDSLALARLSGFSAAVALYPSCGFRIGGWSGMAGSGVYRAVAPVLILTGALDDWTPAEPCRRLTEAAQAAGQPVTMKIYPGAHHSFDSANPVRYVPGRINGSSPTGRGATTGGNAEAWADSIREVAAFFERQLAPPPGPAAK